MWLMHLDSTGYKRQRSNSRNRRWRWRRKFRCRLYSSYSGGAGGGLIGNLEEVMSILEQTTLVALVVVAEVKLWWYWRCRFSFRMGSGGFLEGGDGTLVQMVVAVVKVIMVVVEVVKMLFSSGL